MAVTGPHGVKPSEIRRVAAMTDKVFQLKGLSMYSLFPLLFSRENCDNLRIFKDGTKPVAMMGTLPREISVYGHRLKVGNIGGVSTLPEYGGKGIGTKLLYHVFDRFFKKGVDLMVISGGRGLYRRNKCVPAGMMYGYTIKKNRAGRPDPSVRVVPYTPAHAEVYNRVYQQEPLRYIRSLEDCAATLGAYTGITWYNRKYRSVVIKTKGMVCAVLHFYVAGVEGRTMALVREYAGDRAMIRRCLPVLVQKYRLDEIIFQITVPADPLAVHFKEEGIKGKRIPFFGGWTFRVINFVQMMEKLRPFMAERVGEEAAKALRFSQKGETYSFKYKKEVFSVKGVDVLTYLLLGSNKFHERKLMPVRGELKTILPKILPLPLPLPGLNYV